jgi:predicted  nucleic acid-binding Zn-ribbon protein
MATESVTRIRDFSGDVKSRIASLETQMVNVSEDVRRIEGRVDNQYQQLHSRISDLRDDIRNEIDEKHERLIAKLDEHSKAEAENNKSMSSKISSMEKWRWMIMGGAVVVGYILAHVKLEKLL